MRKIILAVLCVLLGTTPMFGQLSNKVGTAGFQFLRIGVGARETALAESGTATAEGPTAIFWNAAGLAAGDRTEVQVFYNPWFASIKQTLMAVKVPITSDNAFGISVNILTMDDMEETTIDEPQGTGRRFTSGDLAVSLAYAHRISDRFTAGFAAKYVREYIWDMSADGWAFDVGMLYRYENLYLGMVLKDFGANKIMSGGQLESDQQIFEGWDTSPAVVSLVPKGIRLPVSFQFGAGYVVIENEYHRFRATANLAYYMDIGETENVGAEYTFLQDYSVRAGYKFNRDLLGLSFGVGVKTMLASTLLGVDFAAIEMADFGYRTQFSMNMSF
ncbi:MAG: PorV/PorQ family protein [Bacteroidetes bacterium]|nr:PorV/PorQ family protein [Bacteroidota bacterium]